MKRLDHLDSTTSPFITEHEAERKFGVHAKRCQPLPTPEMLLNEMPLSTFQHSFIQQQRQKIEAILDGRSSQYLLIVGPCSIHDTQTAKEYALRLRDLSHEVGDLFHVVMRVYLEKPRTKLGWRGFLYDPHLDGSFDIESGLRQGRQLFLDLTDMEIPIASEFLDPVTAYYLGDLVTWACIGARTSASQTHRQLASGLTMPVGFKNSTDGNIEVAINGILNAVSNHTFIGIDIQGQTSLVNTLGNRYSHLVLRGGKNKPNYDPQSLTLATDLLEQAQLPANLLIDCSHDNSLKQHENQIAVFQSVIHQAVQGNQAIKGLLLESHLQAGNQPFIAGIAFNKNISITDPCLDWFKTEQLIRWGYQILKNNTSA